jgi:hypothetical protein
VIPLSAEAVMVMAVRDQKEVEEQMYMPLEVGKEMLLPMPMDAQMETGKETGAETGIQTVMMDLRLLRCFTGQTWLPWFLQNMP